MLIILKEFLPWWKPYANQCENSASLGNLSSVDDKHVVFEFDLTVNQSYLSFEFDSATYVKDW